MRNILHLNSIPGRYVQHAYDENLNQLPICLTHCFEGKFGNWLDQWPNEFAPEVLVSLAHKFYRLVRVGSGERQPQPFSTAECTKERLIRDIIMKKEIGDEREILSLYELESNLMTVDGCWRKAHHWRHEWRVIICLMTST